MKRPINKKIILAISYEDYVFNSGGVNKVILAQSEIAMSHGYSVVYLCPFHVAKGLIGKSQWLVRVDNEIAMVGTDNDVLTYVGILSKDNYVISGIQIHHLKGINLDSLMNILNSITGNIYFYIHDYYTICPYASGNLLKDDDSLCEVIEGKTPKCKECSRFNGNTRLIREFIYCLSKRTKFIAPSESCKKIWTSYYKEFADKTIVIYHQKLVGNYYGCNEQLDLNSNVNLAFVGKQSSTKGWEDFKYIVSSLAGRSEYNFFCCGNGNEIVNKVKKIEIDFHNGLDAMTCALRDNKIDVVLLLSNGLKHILTHTMRVLLLMLMC